MPDQRPPYVHFGPSPYRQLYALAAVRASHGHHEMVPDRVFRDEAELRAHIAAQLASRPGASGAGELLTARWLLGMVFADGAWEPAWASASGTRARRQQLDLADAIDAARARQPDADPEVVAAEVTAAEHAAWEHRAELAAAHLAAILAHPAFKNWPPSP